MLDKTLRFGMACVASLVLSFATAAWAQEEQADAETPVAEAPAAQAEKPTLKEQWNDLLHYVAIARPDLAKSYGEAILNDPSSSPKEIYLLSIDSPDSQSLLVKAQNVEGMEEIATKMLNTIEEGYKAWRSDPEQIENSIEMMSGTLRAYVIGKERLKESGEYAVPMLIQRLRDPQTSDVLRQRIITMLPEMGKVAVRPFSVALQSQDLRLVEILASALGRIEYPHALPRLRDALVRPDVKEGTQTYTVIRNAIISCSGGTQRGLEKSRAELYYDVANKYYYHAESLQPDIRDADQTAFVWSWTEDLGLNMQAVPSGIFNEVYAMRCARLALDRDASFYAAVPLWLASAINRQQQLPEGTADPLWPADAPQAQYYALASSPVYLQMALVRALADGNADLAKMLISTLGETTGPASLVEPLPGGATPLVAAMGYPDRSVRFLAAETLCLAMPTEEFTGDRMVMMVLNEALRQQGQKVALLFMADQDLRNTTQNVIRTAGLEVQSDVQASSLLMVARQMPALDVVLLGPNVDAAAAHAQLREDIMLRHTPVVMIGAGVGRDDIAQRDPKAVLLSNPTPAEDELTQALNQGLQAGVGQQLAGADAVAWSIRAAQAIRKVGLRSDVIYDITQVMPALSSAIETGSADVQTAAVSALAVIGTQDAQQVAVALALQGQDQTVRIAAFQAATESVRRFGNMATAAQAQTVEDVVTSEGDQPLQQAAAQLLGAMNLPSAKSPQLILGADTID